MKTAGVIGGLGPETTAEFYLEVVFACSEKNREHRPAMLVWNVPIPYALEADILTNVKGEAQSKPLLAHAAKRLEEGGADFIVMPCNTLHIFIKDIRKATRVPVLSVVEETVAFLKRNRMKRVGVIATGMSAKHELYEKALREAGMSVVTPDGLDQARIGKAIHHLVRNRHSNPDRMQLTSVIEKMARQRADCVLLACTDLQLLIPTHSKIPVYDTMKILADATVREILSK